MHPIPFSLHDDKLTQNLLQNSFLIRAFSLFILRDFFKHNKISVPTSETIREQRPCDPSAIDGSLVHV